MKTCFVGHRKIFVENIRERIEDAMLVEMADGCTSFVMGTHGDFDGWALAACRHLRRKFNLDIDVEVAITNLNILKKSNDEYRDNPYDDVKTVVFDVEEEHYKRQIILSNRKMIDECDTLICYVDEKEYRSGAKTAMRYAQSRGLKIVNLYNEQDHPIYGMSQKKIDELCNTICKERGIAKK